MVDERNPLSLHLVPAAFLIGDKLENDVSRRPVGAEQRKIPLENRAVARLRASVAHRDKRNLVDRCLLGKRKGDASREWEHVACAGRSFAFQPLVALNATIGSVAEFAFLPNELDAVDAAI